MPSDNLNLFLPIKKVDVAQRLVYGTLAAEVPDHSNEILDYETSLPYIKTWSGDFSKVTDGKSMGNVRAMHTNVAAGKLTDIAYDDVSKSITGCAKIVDDNEWNKVLEGVYTGFSIGGKYIKRWKDPTNDKLTRYTASMAEVSIVDSPCIPVATFEVIKADGGTEMRKFKVAKDAEEVGVALKQGWQAKDGTFFEKKAEAVSHNVDVAVAEALAPLKKALQEADDALKAKEPVVEPDADESAQKAAQADGKATGSKADDQPAEGAEKAAEAGKPKDKVEIIAKAMASVAMATVKANLSKGMCDVARCAELIESLSWLKNSIQWEADMEGDGSAAPAELNGIIGTLCTFLQSLLAEEASELTADKATGLTQAHVDALRKATGKDDLLKDYTPPVAEVPVNEDLTKLQASHADTLEKLEAVTAEKDAIVKSMGGVTDTISALNKRIEHLEAQPAPAKGIVTTVLKGHEGQESGSTEIPVETQNEIARKYAHLAPELGRELVLRDLQALRAKQ